MKQECPIIFKAESIPAILDGRKTQTRRVDSRDKQPGPFATFDHFDVLGQPVFSDGTVWRARYEVGMMLWVKETWAYVMTTAYRNSESVQQTANPIDTDLSAVYRAGWDRSMCIRWRSPIHMPRWASRITLEITGIRVERLQDITEEDIESEGTPCNPMQQSVYRNDAYQRFRDFAFLWDSINAKRGYPWDLNPWVWVISFQRA